MEQELKEIKQRLKKVQTRETPLLKSEFSKEKMEEIRTQFFDSGAQNWYELISNLTFPTYFIDLSKDCAESLVKEYLYYFKNKEFSLNLLETNTVNEITLLKQKIFEIMKINNVGKFFIKISTRSPKDSPLIKIKALAEFESQFNKDVHTNFEEKLILFCQCYQNNFFVENENEALEYLVSSERVYEDLIYALESDNYDKYSLKVVMREWKEAIPIEMEFRGFVWNKNLNAIGQYYHIFYFKNLFDIKDEIMNSLDHYFNEKLKFLLPESLNNCIVDFAYYDKNNIKIIEINPFDGFALGSFSNSTGLFLLNNEKDKFLIENGPLEIRVNNEPSKEKELKKNVSKKWRESIKGYL